MTDEVLLKVEHLCEYFKMSGGELRAVDDVSFDVKKGEVFGIVGESGCGKTTTGRTIIKLYDATSGNVYLQGRRIVAGTRSYKNAIADAKKQAAADIAKIRGEEAAAVEALGDTPDKERVASARAPFAERIAKRREELNAYVAGQKQEINAAKDDQKNCDRKYARECADKVRQEYAAPLSEAREAAQAAEKGTPERKQRKRAYYKLLFEYWKKLYLARRERLVTKIQMIFQDPIASLNPRMTVREIVAEGLRIKGIRDKAYIDEKVYEVLEMVGLVREHAGRYPHEFSGGQRQRIGVARSIIMNPDVLIADEPVSALDVSIQAQVITLLNDLRNRFGLTILFIAHDLSVVKYFSDRIAVMYYGRIVELAPSDELFEHPLHPYTKSLLSAIPLPDPVYERTRKRLIYNPIAEHDYSAEGPQLREVAPGHFISCNTAEFEKYRKELETK